MSVCCECCVLSSRVLCVGLIILPEQFTDCDREAPNGEALTLKLVEVTQQKQKKVFLMFEYHVTTRKETIVTFLGAFAKLREVTTTFVMSVCPSVLPHGATRLPLTVLHEILCLNIFRGSVAKT